MFVCVLSSIVPFSNHRPRLESDRLSLWATRKYKFSHQTYMLGALDLKGLEVMGSQLQDQQFANLDDHSMGWKIHTPGQGSRTNQHADESL